MLSMSEIRQKAMTKVSVNRGSEIFTNHGVNNMEVSKIKDDLLVVKAHVDGTYQNFYSTSLTIRTADNSASTISEYSCNCPASDKYFGMCKHCIALALAYRFSKTPPPTDFVPSDTAEHTDTADFPKTQEEKNVTPLPSVEKSAEKTADLSPQKTVETSSELLSYMNILTKEAEQPIVSYDIGSVHLIPNLCMADQSHYTYSNDTIEFSIGNKHLYVVKSITELIHNVILGRTYRYGKNLEIPHKRDIFDERSQKLLLWLEHIVHSQNPAVDKEVLFYPINDRNFSLRNDDIATLFSLYYNDTIQVCGYPCQVIDRNPKIKITIAGKKDGAVIQIPTLSLLVVGENGYCLFEKNIYHYTAEFFQKAVRFLEVVHAVVPYTHGTFNPNNEEENKTLTLNEKDYRTFCRSVLPTISSVIEIEYDNIDFSEYAPIDPEYRFHIFTNDEGQLCIKSTVLYGSHSFALYDRTPNEYRRADMEKVVREIIDRYFVETVNQSVCRCEDDDSAYDFLSEGLAQLREYGEIFFEENNADHIGVRKSPTIRVSASLGRGLIDLDVSIDNMSNDDISAVLDAYETKKRYCKLHSGEFLSLEDGSLSSLHELYTNLQIKGNNIAHTELPQAFAQYVNTMLTESSLSAESERSRDFKDLVHKIRDYHDSDYEIPDTLTAVLRGYQKNGYRWLCTLADCGLGGILADDMGLGKTVQTIAYLLHSQKDALIVCPASLLYNWAEEFQKFAPSVTVQLVTGTADRRVEQIKAKATVFVTSYDLLRRDISYYKDKIFGTVILDEAQYIRNSATKAAQTVKQLKSEHRFALTGTPVSNRLADLWSIFDFLIPGYLYSAKRFSELFETPIVHGDEAAQKNLQRMTSAFILRRKKEDVLKELPDKVESVRMIDMTPEQRRIYNAQEAKIRRSLTESNDTDFATRRIEYLTALTRLRQLCCTPELYLENYTGGSGKTEACMELLKQAIDGGHKTLVFSQFTVMLDSLCQEAKNQNIRYLLLTGKNTKEQRRDMIAKFQNGDYDVFFISLKAGGTGLNLTAADRIIHFDPWWNAAAEDQATDRAHRIGQTQTVFVTKLVAKDSIEEKIIDLQEAKRELGNSIISASAMSDSVISREQLLSLLSR